MTVWLPRYEQQAVAGTRAPFDKEWYKFFRELWVALGYGGKNEIYSDIFIDAMQMDDAGWFLSRETLAGGVKAVGFPAGSDESALFTVKLPTNYRNVTDLTVFLEWAPLDAVAGDVVWDFEYAVADQGDAMTTSTTTQVTSSSPEVSKQLTRASVVTIDGTGINAGDVLACRVGRVSSDAADTYANDAGLLGVTIRHRVNGVGLEMSSP